VERPGVIRNLVPGRNMLVVGEPDDSQSPRIRSLREALDAADMHSPQTRDIREVIWSKLVLNLGTSILCTLSGETVGGVRGNPELAGLAALLESGRPATAGGYRSCL